MRTLRLFPLSSVLLPGGRIPLQIFEQRYLDLVRDCMKSSEPFGVIWIRRGGEVAGTARASWGKPSGMYSVSPGSSTVSRSKAPK